MRRIIIGYRHAQGYHNLLKNDQLPDPALTIQGMLQASREKPKAGIVLCSPLLRALQTSQLMFPDTRTIALDCLTEYPYTDRSNTRSSELSLRRLFPNVEFKLGEHVADSPEDHLLNQFDVFHTCIRNLPYTNISIVGHSTWFHSYMLGRVEIPKVELPHCKPIVLDKYI